MAHGENCGSHKSVCDNNNTYPALLLNVVVWGARRGGAVHLVLEGSGHDSFNDAVQLVAVHYPRAVAYLRSFKPVNTTTGPLKATMQHAWLHPVVLCCGRCLLLLADGQPATALHVCLLAVCQPAEWDICLCNTPLARS